MGLQSFERGVERMVDGVFARAFRSQIKPIELGRRLIREMDDHRSIDVRGRTVVPNAFVFYLNERDLTGFADVHDALVRELAEACVEYAADEGYGLMGPVTVELTADERTKPGRFTVASRMLEPKAQGTLVLPGGDRRRLGDEPFKFGRLPENDLVIADPNVSRRHAEIRAVGPNFVIVDLGSTNGTRVNGAAVSQHTLHSGDNISIGATTIRFEAS
jgi:FhaA, N-terminal domain/FHA domain